MSSFFRLAIQLVVNTKRWIFWGLCVLTFMCTLGVITCYRLSPEPGIGANQRSPKGSLVRSATESKN